MTASAASEPERRPSLWACLAPVTQRDRKNMWRFNLALFVWALVFVGGTALLRFGALEGTAAWLPGFAAFGMAMIAVRRYVTFLREGDELLRLIQMEGLAIGFGAGFVFTTTWRLLERAGAPTLDVADPLLVMIVFWTLGQLFAARRYS